MALAVMNRSVVNGLLMLMTEMGLGNRRRERKRDQNDRRPQNSHDQLLRHDALGHSTDAA